MKNFSNRLLLLFYFTGMVIMAESQQLALPKIFGDHMVLQRNAPVHFWGNASPGAVVSVSIDGMMVNATADGNGKWEVQYPQHAEGGPYTVEITSHEKVIYSDVYFGDVWIAGGQSNMEWKLKWGVNNWQEEVENSNYPEIRFFEVPDLVAIEMQEDIPSGNWQIAGPKNSADFSAVAWLFAKHNHLEKNVPVGIIDSNWGGTPAEAWTSAHALLNIEGYQDFAAEMLDPTINWQQRLEENEQKNALKWQLINDGQSFLQHKAHLQEYDDSSWKDIALPNEKPLNGFVWVRKEFELKKKIGSPRLYLGNLEQIAKIFINGKQVAEETWQDTTTIINIPEDLVREGKNTIAIRALNSWNDMVKIGRRGDMWLENNGQRLNLEGKWRYSNSIEPEMPKVEFFNWKPGVLFNGMIKPIAGYTIAGAIWYQGESNTDKAQYYEQLFKGMITDWRSHWGQGDFPFLFVQLANFMERKATPSQSRWAELREAQAKTLSLPNTGMAVTIDIGDSKDIHPRNKQDVAYRLWMSARKVAYNENIVSSGPIYDGCRVVVNKIYLTFKNIGSGLTMPDRDVNGFAIAGEDSVFYWATAVIEGNEIKLSSKDVPSPRYVQYAWADNPEAGLYNAEGLPAVPFRTDKKHCY